MTVVTEPTARRRRQAAASPVSADASLFQRSFRKVVFATHIWEGSYVIPQISAVMNGKVLDRTRVGRPPASLMPKPLAKEVDAARNAIYKVLDAHTFPCDAKGTRLVPTSDQAEFIEAWTVAVEQFDSVADKVRDEYDAIVQYNREYWLPQCAVYKDGGAAVAALAAVIKTPAADPDDQYERVSRLERAVEAQYDEAATEQKYVETIGRKIPNRDELRAQFAVEYVLADPGGHASKYEKPALREFFETAKSNADEQAEELTRALVEEPAKRLAEALAALKERIRTGEKLSPASFTDVNQALSLCRACGAALPEEMRTRVDGAADAIAGALGKAHAMKSAGGTYTDAVKGHADVLGEAFDAVIDAAHRKVGQAEMLAKFGVKARGIRYNAD